MEHVVRCLQCSLPVAAAKAAEQGAQSSSRYPMAVGRDTDSHWDPQRCRPVVSTHNFLVGSLRKTPLIRPQGIQENHC